MVKPNRAAEERSIARSVSRPLFCWSELTSVSSGSCCSAWVILGAHRLISSRSSPCSVYWYWPFDCRPPTRMSCAAWKNSVAPGTTAISRRSRAITSVAGGRSRRGDGRERADHKAAGGRAAAGEAHHAVHCRIGVDDADELGQLLRHQLEGDALIGLDAAGEPSGVLLREKALGHDVEEKDVEAERGDQDEQHQRRAAQRPSETAGISLPRPLEDALARAGDARQEPTPGRRFFIARAALVAQEIGAHHRRGRERYQQ